MGDNRSKRWGHQDQERTRRAEELADVLDGADVSERVRAAISRALDGPDGRDAYVEVLLNRYATEREGRSRMLVPPFAYDQRHRWTVHLTFPALNLRDARDLALSYAEALAILRPELAAVPATLSRAESWNHLEPLFCGAVGPDDEICQDVAGHPGFHRAAGLGGLCWGGGDNTGTDGGRAGSGR